MSSSGPCCLHLAQLEATLLAGQIGFDEGGVLEALSKPIIHREVTYTKTYKSGRVKTDTTVLEISAAHIIGFLVWRRLVDMFGASGLGPDELEDWLKDRRDDFGNWINDIFSPHEEPGARQTKTYPGRLRVCENWGYTRDSCLQYMQSVDAGTPNRGLLVRK